MRFWAERYTMEAGQCTPMHWKVTRAKSVLLDTAAVGATGVTNACPGLSQFYTLQVEENGGNVTEYQLTLWAGDPDLQTGQAIVQSVTPVADLDPQTEGNQAGYQVQLTNVARLYSKDASWNQSAVTLAVPQSLIDYGFSGPVHAGEGRAGGRIPGELRWRGVHRGRHRTVVPVPAVRIVKSTKET